jgi:hypothetical protein
MILSDGRRLETLSPLSPAASAAAQATSGTPPRTLIPSLYRRLCLRATYIRYAASNPSPLSLPPPLLAASNPYHLSRRLEPLSPLSPLLPLLISPLSPAALSPLSLPPPRTLIPSLASAGGWNPYPLSRRLIPSLSRRLETLSPLSPAASAAA